MGVWGWRVQTPVMKPCGPLCSVMNGVTPRPTGSSIYVENDITITLPTDTLCQHFIARTDSRTKIKKKCASTYICKEKKHTIITQVYKI